MEATFGYFNLFCWYTQVSKVVYHFITYLLMVADLHGHETVSLDSSEYQLTFLMYRWKKEQPDS